MDQTPESCRCDLRTLFAERGIRCTRQRAEVYDALRATDAHPTAEELFLSVRRSHPGISLATVYNTLEVLTRAGLCRRLSNPHEGAGAPCRFDADTREHVHLIHSDGSVKDLPDDLGRRLLESLPPEALAEVEERLGVSIDRLAINLIADSESRDA